MKTATTTGAGLYLHVPFCQTKCGYCDFFSVPDQGQNRAGLVKRLLEELDARMAANQSAIRTIFVGGGTPTVLPIELFARLIGRIKQLKADHPVTEFTVEANPATLDEQKAALLVDAGVNRLSVGAQSFSPTELITLERIHEPADVPRAFAIARMAGISNINVDLIFGIPGQTSASWADSLGRALSLQPDHIALYGLTYEPNTAMTGRLKRGEIVRCDEDLEADMYEYAMDTTAAHGFEQYEISNFAKPGRRCAHNIGYWNNQPYIGVGPSAAGYIDGMRYRNVAHVERYMQMIDSAGNAVVETEQLVGTRAAAETVMLQLRLIDGIDRLDFRNRVGNDLMALAARTATEFERLGMLAINEQRIALTRKGRLLADSVIASIMDDLDDLTPVAATVTTPAGSPSGS